MTISRTEQAVGVVSALLSGGAFVAFQRGLLTTREQRIAAVATAVILALGALAVAIHAIYKALTAGRVTPSRENEVGSSDSGDPDLFAPPSPREERSFSDHSTETEATSGVASHAENGVTAPPEARGRVRKSSHEDRRPPPTRPLTAVHQSSTPDGRSHYSVKPTTPLSPIPGGDTPEGGNISSPAGVPPVGADRSEPAAASLPPATSSAGNCESEPLHLREDFIRAMDERFPQPANGSGTGVPDAPTFREDSVSVSSADESESQSRASSSAGKNGKKASKLPLGRAAAGGGMPGINTIKQGAKGLQPAEKRELPPAPQSNDPISVLQRNLNEKFANVRQEEDFGDD